jgi:hypothetical protein
MQRVKGLNGLKNKEEHGISFINPERQAVKHLLKNIGMTNREFKKANKKLARICGKKYVLKNGIMELVDIKKGV